MTVDVKQITPEQKEKLLEAIKILIENDLADKIEIVSKPNK